MDRSYLEQSSGFKLSERGITLMPSLVHEVKFYFIGCFCCFGSVCKVSDVRFYENKKIHHTDSSYRLKCKMRIVKEISGENSIINN